MVTTVNDPKLTIKDYDYAEPQIWALHRADNHISSNSLSKEPTLNANACPYADERPAPSLFCYMPCSLSLAGRTWRRGHWCARRGIHGVVVAQWLGLVTFRLHLLTEHLQTVVASVIDLYHNRHSYKHQLPTKCKIKIGQALKIPKCTDSILQWGSIQAVQDDTGNEYVSCLQPHTTRTTQNIIHTVFLNY